MVVNNPDKKFITLAQGGKHKYRGNLLQYFNPRITRVKNTRVIFTSVLFNNIGTWIHSGSPKGHHLAELFTFKRIGLVPKL